MARWSFAVIPGRTYHVAATWSPYHNHAGEYARNAAQRDEAGAEQREQVEAGAPAEQCGQGDIADAGEDEAGVAHQLLGRRVARGQFADEVAQVIVPRGQRAADHDGGDPHHGREDAAGEAESGDQCVEAWSVHAASRRKQAAEATGHLPDCHAGACRSRPCHVKVRAHRTGQGAAACIAHFRC